MVFFLCLDSAYSSDPRIKKFKEEEKAKKEAEKKAKVEAKRKEQEEKERVSYCSCIEYEDFKDKKKSQAASYRQTSL